MERTITTQKETWFFVHAHMKQTLSPRLLIADDLIFHFIIAKLTPYTQLFEQNVKRQTYDTVQLIDLLNRHFMRALNVLSTFYNDTASFVANGDRLWEHGCYQTVTTIEFLLR